MYWSPPVCFSVLATSWSALYLIAGTPILINMAWSTGLCCTARELHVDGWRKIVINRRFPKFGKILMIYLQKIFYKFEISILKYYDSENLNHFQVLKLLFRQSLSHSQSSINFMFVSNDFVFTKTVKVFLKHYFFKWL